MKFILIIMLWFAVFIPDRVSGQSICIPYGTIVERLYSRFKELPDHLGTTNGKTVIIFHNVNTRTFTIVLVYANGVACILTSGSNWSFKRVDKGFPT